MSNDVDLRALAIDREGTRRPGIRAWGNVPTRYLLPLSLLLGFLMLVVWAARDLINPPTGVTVVPVLATTAEVRAAGTPLFQAAGWIEPRPTPIRVAALAPGVVQRLLVVEDQAVRAGEPIAELVKDDAQLTLRRANADVALRRAELDEARAALVAAETRLKQPVHLVAALNEAESFLAKIATQLKNLPFEIRRAEADYGGLRKDYEGKLAAAGVVAGVQIDLAESKAISATALVEELKDRKNSLTAEENAAKARRDALRTQLELLADEIKAKDEARARIKAATARIDQTLVVVAQAQLELERMTITAPVEGRVFRLIAHPGARIGSGMTQMAGHDGSTIITMYQPRRLQVRVDTRFEDIPKVSLGQPVEIDNPALAAPLKGNVLFISSEADIQKNTLQVKVGIPDPPSVFKPEMLVDVTFLAPPQPDTPAMPTREIKLYAPRQLILQHDGDAVVWLADQSEGVARRTKVRTGAVAAGGLVEILEGLTISSRLITNASESLKDGGRIAVTSEDPTLGTNGTGAPSRTPNALAPNAPAPINPAPINPAPITPVPENPPPNRPTTSAPNPPTP